MNPPALGNTIGVVIRDGGQEIYNSVKAALAMGRVMIMRTASMRQGCLQLHAPLQSGTFIRVRRDHPDWWRAGQDGMVVEDMGGSVALIFCYDRHNIALRHSSGEYIACVGPELWAKTELDMTTVEV